MIRPQIVAFLLAFTASSAASGEEISGRPRVVDGDTIEIGATKIRLEGIDAPESAQTCLNAGGRSYPCGEVATRRAQQLTAGKPATCRGDAHDRYGRLLAVCSAGGVEINDTLVREGLAWAFIRYSQSYVAAEQEARRAKRGVFAAANTPPWEFRAGLWGEAEQRELAWKGCVIKGNVNRRGEHIYHMPWQRDYARVNMHTGADKRWFCTERDAEEAGWRRAIR